MDKHACWVKVVEDRVCVVLMAGRENDNFEVLACKGEQVRAVRSNVEARLN